MNFFFFKNDEWNDNQVRNEKKNRMKGKKE